MPIGDEDAEIVGSFTGPIDLSERLGHSQAVRQCVVDNWLRYVNLRDLEGDECSQARAFEAFEASGHRLDALVRGTIDVPAFRFQSQRESP